LVQRDSKLNDKYKWHLTKHKLRFVSATAIDP